MREENHLRKEMEKKKEKHMRKSMRNSSLLLMRMRTSKKRATVRVVR
jgi:flagellar biosynthesis chaperone FliJ